MWRPIISSAKAVISVLTVLSFSCAQGQQHVIADANLTRPEINRQYSNPPAIHVLTARMNNGDNDIQWTATNEQNTRKYIVEYSKDGMNFQAAGEVLVTNTANYSIKHQTLEYVPLLYRLRIEDLDGRHTYSKYILLEGVSISPVKIYPTIISGNVVNVNAYFPIERVTIFNGSGQQVHAQDIGGRSGLLNIPVPSLGKGMYWMVFQGRGWKTTEKFIVS